MSFRIIRRDDRANQSQVTQIGMGEPRAALLGHDHMMNVEKQAFEQGYQEGERIGKQMGERMMETTVKRYERSVQDLAQAHRQLSESMEKQTVQFALQVARKIIHREAVMDPDLVGALVAVALKRVQSHQSIVVRVHSSDAERVNAIVRTAGSSIVVKDDPALERGDFVIDTHHTHVDGRISSQLDTIGRAIFDE